MEPSQAATTSAFVSSSASLCLRRVQRQQFLYKVKRHLGAKNNKNGITGNKITRKKPLRAQTTKQHIYPHIVTYN